MKIMSSIVIYVIHIKNLLMIFLRASFDKILFLLGIEHDMKIINKSYTKIIEHAMNVIFTNMNM